jgi:Mitochondrial carrier protein
MNQAFVNGKGQLYSSAISCFLKTTRQEGLRALYKGWLPSWLRLGPHSIITFIVLEKLRFGFGLAPF